MDEMFTMVSRCDFHDLADFAAATDKLLTALDADRLMLRSLIEEAADNPELVQLCEHYDILDKLVLHDDPTGWRLRVHVFAPGYFDRPHNHRWSYASRVLHGSYTHTLYGTDDGQLDMKAPHVDVAALQPRMVRTEQAGHTYTLHHSMIHAVTAQPYTTTLVVRGPAVKHRFVVTDRTTGQAWWQHGAATESSEQAARKRMTADDVRGVATQMFSLGVLPPP